MIGRRRRRPRLGPRTPYGTTPVVPAPRGVTSHGAASHGVASHGASPKAATAHVSASRQAAPPHPPTPGVSRRRRFPRRLLARAAVFLVATAAAALLVRFAAGVVAGLPFFAVNQVQVEGAVYLDREEVRAAAGLTSSTNLWEPKAAWIERIESHPLVEWAEVRRRPPSTLLVRIREVEPVALIASPLVEAVDARGAPVDVDPSNPVLDLPLIRVLDTDSAVSSRGRLVVAGEVRRIGEVAPEVLSVVSEAHWQDGLVTLLLGDSGPRLRYRPPMEGRRLREGVVAMNDALERFPDHPPQEVDLRFEGQVVVRSGEGEGPP